MARIQLAVRASAWMRGILLVAAWSGARWGLASAFEDGPHLLSLEAEIQSLELPPSLRSRSLATCTNPFPCTPVLYFSTLALGPSETAIYDKFPFGTEDTLVCDSASRSVMTLGGFSAKCRRVVQDVKIKYTAPDGHSITRVDKKQGGTPFTVFGKSNGGSSWTGRRLAIGEHTVQLEVRGAGGCDLWKTTYRFRVTKSSQCLKVQGPCDFVNEIPNLSNRTLAALKIPSSPQARAYKWVMTRAKQLLQSDPTYCIDAMRNLFGIATFRITVESDDTKYLERLLRDPDCNHTRLCEDALQYDGDGGDDFIGFPEELFLANWVTSIRFNGPDPTFTNPMGVPIPSQFGGLTALTDLSISGNIAGTITTELVKLTDLGSLSLSSPLLTGTIPNVLGRLTNLERLSISHSALTGTIPSELGAFPQLKFLYLGNNDLTGTIISELLNLQTLQGLHLDGNQLSGTIPGGLGGLSTLQILLLGRNSLHGTIPSEFGLLTGLLSLDLSFNALTGTIPLELNQTALVWLELPSTNVTPGVVPCLPSAYIQVDCDSNGTEFDLGPWSCPENCPMCSLNCYSV